MPSLKLRSGAALAYTVDEFTDPWQRATQPVVFLHGLAERGEAWRAWVAPFARHFQVVRFDQRGFGDSDPLEASRPWSIDDTVNELAEMAQALDVEPFHLVSAKLGGTIGMAFAARFPERVRSLSVVSSPASLQESLGSVLPQWTEMVRTHGVRHWARQTMGARLGKDMPAAGVEWWTQMMGSTRKETMLSIFPTLAQVDVRSRLPAIRCPTLVMTTTGSRLGAVESIAAWQQLIPDSRLVVVDSDSYHIAASSPDASAREVLEFVRRHT